MIFLITVKPKKVGFVDASSFELFQRRFRTKYELTCEICRIFDTHFTISTNGTGYCTDKGQFIGINFEKRRRKVKQTKDKGRSINSEIRPAHWVAYVYQIPAGFKVIQEARTFKVKQIKRG